MATIFQIKDLKVFFQSLTPDGYTLKQSFDSYWYESEDALRTYEINVFIDRYLPSFLILRGVQARCAFKEVELIYNTILKDYPYSDSSYGNKTFTVGSNDLNTVEEQETLNNLEIETTEQLESTRSIIENGISQALSFFETYSDVSTVYNAGEQLFSDIGTNFTRSNIALISNFYENGTTIPAKRAIMKYLTGATDYQTYIDTLIADSASSTAFNAERNHAYYTALKVYLSNC